MNIAFSLIAVAALILCAMLGAGLMKLEIFFGVVLPYASIMTFLVGIVARVLKWARSPVPFHVPTVAGQQASLPWIKSAKLESPRSTWGVVGRMFFEIVFFRSLFRNTRTELKNGANFVYGSSKYLWFGAIAFHWSLLLVFLRHFRFFVEPVPSFVLALQSLDGFFQVGLPTLFITDVSVIVALLYLTARRMTDSRLRYISLASDFFPLFLILSIAVTGVLMRYFYKVDTPGVKELAIGLFTFRPVVPDGIGELFFIHLFLVCVLISYFPFSKLLHMAGIFLSPTRNLANDSRMNRHVNPWNHPVKVHRYENYEDEFRDKMKAAGIPVDKE